MKEQMFLCCDFGYDVTSPIPSAEPGHKNFHTVVPAVVGTTVKLFPNERLEVAEFVSDITNENGQTVGEWFETPNVSAIRTTVEEDTRTRTKAGWIIGQEAGYTASADAGIVYEAAHPYVLAIMSDYPAAVNKLEQYASLLEQMHTLLAEETGK